MTTFDEKNGFCCESYQWEINQMVNEPLKTIVREEKINDAMLVFFFYNQWKSRKGNKVNRNNVRLIRNQLAAYMYLESYLNHFMDILSTSY